MFRLFWPLPAQRYGFTAEAFAPFAQLLERPVAQFDPSVLRAAGLGEMVDVFLHAPQADDHTARLLLFTGKKADVSRLEPALAAQTMALAPGELETTLLQQLGMEKRLGASGLDGLSGASVFILSRCAANLVCIFATVVFRCMYTCVDVHYQPPANIGGHGGNARWCWALRQTTALWSRMILSAG